MNADNVVIDAGHLSAPERPRKRATTSACVATHAAAAAPNN